MFLPNVTPHDTNLELSHSNVDKAAYSSGQFDFEVYRFDLSVVDL